ncbi:MAG: DUF429 domain-containing protein [Aggregatilineales bacterium]
MRFVGVDGCRYGWFAVAIDEHGTLNYAVFADIQSLWERHADAQIILIDMPIGLAETGRRRCETEARRVLGARRSSIFSVPTRAALYAETYEQASTINQQITGLKLSKQTWNIIPKIRELDELLRSNAHARLKMAEVHPEVLFWGLAGAPMVESKKTTAGYAERVRILQDIVPDAKAMIDSAMQDYRRADVARDDIVDALVIAVTARIGDLKSFPPNPDRDEYGLPMQILYAHHPQKFGTKVDSGL